MSLTPPPGMSLLDLWLFKEVLRRLRAHEAIPCPRCSRSVNLAPSKRAIEEAVRMAAEDDH